MNIEQFQAINAMSGRAFGDKVLRAIGDEIRRVESEKGVGTTFTVTVKLKASERTADADGLSANEEADADRSLLSGLRVLLAEDVDANAEILADVLDLEDIVSERAENGRIALEMFTGKPAGYYDLILMDVRMPEMDGLTATREIRALERDDAKIIPIIAMTANVFDEDIKNSQEAGMNAHLSKPIEPERLYETMIRLIKEVRRDN